MWTFHNQWQRCAGEEREKVFDTLMKMRKRRNMKIICLPQRSATCRTEGITVIIKIEKEGKRKANEIAFLTHLSAGSTNAEKEMEIEAKTEGKKTDRMTIIMRETSMTNEEIEKEKRNVRTESGTVIREEIKAETDRREEARKETIIAIGIGIVIMRESDPRKMKTDTGINRISIRENGEKRRILRKSIRSILIKEY